MSPRLNNEFIFKAYVCEITCMDEDGVRFDAYTDDNIPTKHCYLPTETINAEHIIIAPNHQYKIQGILFNELEIKVTQCKNIDNNYSITTNLVLGDLYDKENGVIPITINNALANIYNTCICTEPLIVGKRYTFNYAIVNDEIVVNECIWSDIPRDLQIDYLLEDKLSEKEINCAILYEQAVMEHLRGKPALKTHASGHINKITENEFRLYQTNGTIFYCVVLNSIQNHFEKEIVDNFIKTVNGYIFGGKMYVTNCSDVEKNRHRHKRIYLKK